MINEDVNMIPQDVSAINVTPKIHCGDAFDGKMKHSTSSRCRCGCVPNILSMFEMAQLRAKRKLLLEENSIAIKGEK